MFVKLYDSFRNAVHEILNSGGCNLYVIKACLFRILQVFRTEKSIKNWLRYGIPNAPTPFTVSVTVISVWRDPLLNHSISAQNGPISSKQKAFCHLDISLQIISMTFFDLSHSYWVISCSTMIEIPLVYVTAIIERRRVSSFEPFYLSQYWFNLFQIKSFESFRYISTNYLLWHFLIYRIFIE